jgi:hypothetical protein
MKKLIIALATALASLHAEAAVLRVNNNAGSAAPYSSLQSAITAATAGDTIYVEGSATDYGYITMAKRLNLVGTGYFLSESTPNPRTQANPNPSSLGSITFSPGSKGSVVQGFNIGGITLNDSLVTIQRNKINSSVAFGYNNPIAFDTLRDNYLTSYMACNSSNTVTGLMIYNNIFTYTYIMDVTASNMNVVSGYFINNSFPLSTNTFKCVGFVFQNNIFGATLDFSGYVGSNTFFNNVSVSSTGIPSGNNNVRGVSSGAIYLSAATPASTDGKYQLQASSPAAGVGYMNGATVDCGAYGGPAPYILSGMPSIPSIYSLTAPAQVAHGTSTINVSFSTAAH